MRLVSRNQKGLLNMRLQQISLLFILARVLAGCLTLSLSGYVYADNEIVAFDLPAHTEAIVLPVMLGRVERLCVLDSGATTFMFHTSLRQVLGQPIGKTTAGSANGERFGIEIFSAPAAKIGSIELDQKSPVACFDISAVREAIGRDVEGMLGMPLFRSNIIRLDFDRRRIEILPSSCRPSADWGNPVKISMKSGVPTVTVDLPGGVKEECTVDTGFTGSISLATDVFSKLSNGQAILPLEDRSSILANGMRQRRRGKLSMLTIDDFESKSLIVLDGGKGSRLGLQYLRRYRVTFDLGRNQLYLAKGMDFNGPDKASLIGIGLLRRNDRTLVAEIQRNSPGEKAGILAGDEVISVAGESIDGMSLGEARWKLRELPDSHRSVEIGIRRTGKARTITVSLQD